VQDGDESGSSGWFDPGRDAPNGVRDAAADVERSVERWHAGRDPGLVVEVIDALVSVPVDGARVVR